MRFDKRRLDFFLEVEALVCQSSSGQNTPWGSRLEVVNGAKITKETAEEKVGDSKSTLQSWKTLKNLKKQAYCGISVLLEWK